MKKLGLGFLAVFAFGLAVQAHAAPEVKFVLPCSWDMSSRNPVQGALKFLVQKTATQAPTGRWETTYQLLVKDARPASATIVYDLTPAGEGDEDYETYHVVPNRPHEKLFIQSVSIHNRFRWAMLIDRDGLSSFRCEKRFGN